MRSNVRKMLGFYLSILEDDIFRTLERIGGYQPCYTTLVTLYTQYVNFFKISLPAKFVLDNPFLFSFMKRLYSFNRRQVNANEMIGRKWLSELFSVVCRVPYVIVIRPLSRSSVMIYHCADGNNSSAQPDRVLVSMPQNHTYTHARISRIFSDVSVDFERRLVSVSKPPRHVKP